MSLPHFNNTKNHNNYNTISSNLFDIKFENLHLRNNCYSVVSDEMRFNLFIDNDGSSLEPLEIVEHMITHNKKIEYLEISNFNIDGKLQYSIFLENFSFVEIVDFLDFDWNEFNQIKYLRVKFKYDRRNIIYYRNYEKYIRKIKLKSINKKES